MCTTPIQGPAQRIVPNFALNCCRCSNLPSPRAEIVACQPSLMAQLWVRASLRYGVSKGCEVPASASKFLGIHLFGLVKHGHGQLPSNPGTSSFEEPSVGWERKPQKRKPPGLVVPVSWRQSRLRFEGHGRVCFVFYQVDGPRVAGLTSPVELDTIWEGLVVLWMVAKSISHHLRNPGC